MIKAIDYVDTPCGKGVIIGKTEDGYHVIVQHKTEDMANPEGDKTQGSYPMTTIADRPSSTMQLWAHPQQTIQEIKEHSRIIPRKHKNATEEH